MIGQVDDISSYAPFTEILYKCAICGTSFRILGSHEKFCHGCGSPVEWNYMPTHLTKPLRELGITTYEAEREFIRQLNSRISNKEFENQQ